jgi:inosose dehydratase
MKPALLSSTGKHAVSRREFLKASGAAAAAATVGTLGNCAAESPGAAPLKPLAGSQLYGWGQYYQRENKNLNDHLDEVLSALRDAGYDYAEGSMDAQHPENNVRFAEQLKAKGLRPVSLYTGGRLHDASKSAEVVQSLLRAAKVCAGAGFGIINCNPDPIGREKTEDELKTQVAALRELGTGLKGLGLRLGIHHHTPEMLNHAREFHYNFRHADAGLVDFCFDVHWVYRGGLPPMEALEQYGARVVSWHLRQSRGGPWWEDLATGDIDYAQIARYAKQHGLAPRYTVELALENGTKITRSVVENHRRSREFVREVFGC